MFILRTIENNVPTNTILGDRYSFIGRHENYADFCRNFKLYFLEDHVADLDPNSGSKEKNCHAFISYSSELIPLYNNQTNYIMTGDGQTFENVSQR